MIILIILLLVIVGVLLLAKFLAAFLISGIILIYGVTAYFLYNFFGEHNHGLALLATLPVGTSVMCLLMAISCKNKNERVKLLLWAGGGVLLGIIISLFITPS